MWGVYSCERDLTKPLNNRRKRSELIIRAAVRNDSGQYECRAKNKMARQTVSRGEWVNVTNPSEDPRKYNTHTHAMTITRA